VVGTVVLLLSSGQRPRTSRPADWINVLKLVLGWMSQNNGAIMAVICLVIGAKLIGAESQDASLADIQVPEPLKE